jgi:hypothetical protein
MNANIAAAKKAIRIDDRPRVWTFFLAFSRFEYALKQAGYTSVGRNGNVSANWQSFASEHQHQFDAGRNPDVHAAFKYFIRQRPKKQTLTHDVLTWRESPPIGKAPALCWLVQMIAVVRNNLFHGGKFPWQVDPCRNATLIRHALCLLDDLVDLDERVKHYFTGRN